MLVDSPSNAWPIIKDDWRNEFLLVDEGSSLQPSLEGGGQVGSQGVANDVRAMLQHHVAVAEMGDRGAGSPNVNYLVCEGGYVIKVIKQSWKYVTPIIIGSGIFKHICSFGISLKFSLSRSEFATFDRFILRLGFFIR